MAPLALVRDLNKFQAKNNFILAFYSSFTTYFSLFLLCSPTLEADEAWFAL